jgi:hypothetical protein
MADSSRQTTASRLRIVIFFLVIVAVIDHGHLQSPWPGPSGFTRIARDLGRKFCSHECEGLTHPWMQ